MNKRKQKKLAKKRELFIASWATSYKEVKQLDRSYHEYIVQSKRSQRYMEQHNIRPADAFKF